MREILAATIIAVALVGWMLPVVQPPAYQSADDNLGRWFDCRWH